MVLELPVPWVIALNAGGLPAMQVGLAWLFTRLPSAWFEQPERSGGGMSPAWYERALRIKRWKTLVPDGAGWFEGGFAKASLHDSSRSHLARFVTETRRGEACHWSALAAGPVFVLWNPVWAAAVMLAALLVANVPCILIQRYNRARLLRVLGRRSE